MVTALYTGSFDPFHVGHLDLVTQSARQFDDIVVAVLGNPAKRGLLSKLERVRLIEASVTHLDNVRVVAHSGMAIEAAAASGASFIVRSAHKECSSELTMAMMNAALSDVETVFLLPDPGVAWVSSTFVRRALEDGMTDLVQLVTPRPVADALLTQGSANP